ncbi:gamma-glutamylcyclotransferase family protein [Lacipirellula sp.]|uniref:gamma-glutamylcyclotransferase family protein n=1 Tax=Lacipirellula sp. TaxID=2691419 RepID=UPI003D0E1C24
MTNLFAYGTLMFPEVWERVVGGRYRQAPATVCGMRVVRAAGKLYPVMIAGAAEDVARGIVIYDLSAEALTALDEYEASFYERVEVAAVLDDGSGAASAQAYLLPQSHRQLASDEAWVAEVFERDKMGDYFRYLGWDR